MGTIYRSQSKGSTDWNSFKVTDRKENEVFAKLFGGGGHKTGAGAKLFGINSLNEALDIVFNKLNL